ncbi:hypothetical protein MLD38_019464 [Melastoma candidum]|uniref:Uncharacterized protein n=1 Tax=Melastoma candidum TaxID=119954 RepID=A0ACB9QYY5_9MYRT|nr:hypothetical protein MLD38_019464 [Melastoma candidum]
MALKFLNKKGWHTGSLRNIENVWKAEQKHEAEQKKLEELRKQIHDERERHEFRLLQQQAGLLPSQERLEFLYDSGLAVGKVSSSEGVSFKTVDKLDDASGSAAPGASSSSQAASAVPGALFEEKGPSANDAWRKLHTDPLLLIRQREQEALARIKNNPVQMAMIRKSVIKKGEDKDREKKGDKKNHRHKHSKHKKLSASPIDSDDSSGEERVRKSRSHRSSRRHGQSRRVGSDLEEDLGGRGSREERTTSYDFKSRERLAYGSSDLKSRKDADRDTDRRSKRENYESEGRPDSRKEGRVVTEGGHYRQDNSRGDRYESRNRYRNAAPKLTEEERAARLRGDAKGC